MKNPAEAGQHNQVAETSPNTNSQRTGWAQIAPTVLSPKRPKQRRKHEQDEGQVRGQTGDDGNRQRLLRRRPLAPAQGQRQQGGNRGDPERIGKQGSSDSSSPRISSRRQVFAPLALCRLHAILFHGLSMSWFVAGETPGGTARRGRVGLSKAPTRMTVFHQI